MIRVQIFTVVACLVLAGYATASARARSGSSLLSAKDRFALETDSGTVETLVVRNTVGEHSSEKPALLIGLHGYGMDESQIATLVDVEPKFAHLYLAPRGFHALADGSRAWFPIETDGDSILVGQQALLDFVARFENYVEAAVEKTGADSEAVYVIGYSQGGAASISLSLLRPDLAKAFVAFAGAVIDKALIARTEIASSDLAIGTKVFVGHGTLDALIPTDGMRESIRMLRAQGLDVTYREYEVPHVVSAAQRRDAVAWLESVASRN